MPSLDDLWQAERTVVPKTALLLLAVAINAIELFTPRLPFFPWLKPGLANIVTIVWIVRYGFVDALLFSILRIWSVAFYFGFSFVTLTLSLGGALSSCTVMAMVWYCAGRRGSIGAMGIAICGALAHNAAQLMVVYLLLARNLYLLYQVPAMLVASVLFGAVVGWLAAAFLPVVDDGEGDVASVPPSHPRPWPGTLRTVLGSLILAGCMALVFVDRRWLLSAAALVTTVVVQMIERGSWQALLFPLRRFWLLFLFVAVLYGLFGYGTRVEGIPLLTYEGIDRTVAQWLRLWTWLEASFLLTAVHFHTTAFHGLRRLFPTRRGTLYAGLRGVELFPRVMDLVGTDGRRLVRVLLRSPRAMVADLYRRMLCIAASGEATTRQEEQ
jgi:heptaprenyl diphosphate synthase